MPEKKNSRGNMQNYDPKTGRYSKANVIDQITKLDYKTIFINSIISDERISHITIGEFNKLNRLINGGHAQNNIEYMIENNIQFEINIKYNNGVRVGMIKDSINRKIREECSHTWFPESWSNDDIINAILCVYNNDKEERTPRKQVSGEYNGIIVIIIYGEEGTVSTAFPNKEQKGGIVYDKRKDERNHK